MIDGELYTLSDRGPWILVYDGSDFEVMNSATAKSYLPFGLYYPIAVLGNKSEVNYTILSATEYSSWFNDFGATATETKFRKLRNK